MVASVPVPFRLNPFSVLEMIEVKGVRPQMVCYQMLMECLASVDQIQGGFALIARMEADGSLSISEDNCYPMFRMLLEACRTVSGFNTTFAQAAIERLCSIALAPVATMLTQVCGTSSSSDWTMGPPSRQPHYRSCTRVARWPLKTVNSPPIACWFHDRLGQACAHTR